MNKEIKFLMKFDTSEFDKAVEKMQRQLKEVYRPADQAGAQRQTASRLEGIGLPGGGKAGLDSYFKSIQTARRDMDNLLQKYSKDQQSLAKDIAANEKFLEKKIRLQAEATKGSKEELMIITQKKIVEEQLFRMRESWMARNQAMNQAIDARQNLGPKDKMERLMTAFGGGGMGGGIKEAGAMAGDWWKGLGITGQAGMVISGLLAAARGVGKIGDVATAYHGLPLGVASAQGAATQGIYGREIQAAAGGSQLQEMAFMPEKQQAAGMAKEHLDSQRFWDRMASGKAALDASEWLVAHHLPKIAAATLAVSGIQHGVSALGFGGGGDSGARRQQMALGTFSQRNSDMYQSMSAEQYAKEYAKATEDLKLQNPLKAAAVDNFAANSAGNLAFQRATGLDYGSFHGPGGFREQQINAGFTDQMGMEASTGILAGGGSTRGAQGLGIMSMQAQRGMDLTNANSVIGKLSGNMGDNENTRQAFVKMLAESTRLGLDSSQFREENRRFMDAAATVIQQSGTRSQPDIESLLKAFGGFAGDKTPAGMEKAQGAYQMYVEQTSQTAGPQGAMRAGAFLRSDVIGKFSGQDMAKLANVDTGHLTSDNPIIADLAAKYFPQDPAGGAQRIIEASKKAGMSSLSRTGRGDTIREKLMGLRDQLSKTPQGAASDYIRKNLNEQIKGTENQLIGELSLGPGGKMLANDPIFAREYAQGISQAGGQMMTPEEFKAQQDKLAGKDTGRTEDKAVQAAAESARLMVTAFQQFHDTIVPSVQAVGEFNGKILELVASMKGMTPAEKAKFLQDNAKLLGTVTPKTQASPGQEKK